MSRCDLCGAHGPVTEHMVDLTKLSLGTRDAPRIRMLTFNMNASSKAYDNDDIRRTVVKPFLEQLDDSTIDIFVFCIQEAPKSVQWIVDALKKRTRFKVVHSSLVDEVHGDSWASRAFHNRAARDFFLHQIIVYNEEVADVGFEGSRCFGKLRTCVKGSLISAIRFGWRGDDAPPDIYVVNSHLPVDTKDKETFGMAKRVTAMRTTLEGLGALYGRKSAVLWTGDLNYRQMDHDDWDGEYEIRPGRNEQLSMLMRDGSQYNASFLEDFQEGERYRARQKGRGVAFNPTCKLVATPGDRNRECRRKEDDDRKIVLDCYDQKRSPSWCDRIIYRDSVRHVVLCDDYASFGENAHMSDHNMVVASLSIENQF